MERNRAETMKRSSAHVLTHYKMKYTLKGYAFSCTHMVNICIKIKVCFWLKQV